MSISESNKFNAAGADTQLSRFTHLRKAALSPVEFKVAAFLYELLELSGGEPVRRSARAIAAEVQVSERSVESVRKKLAAQGIIAIKTDSHGSWYSFPEEPAGAETEKAACAQGARPEFARAAANAPEVPATAPTADAGARSAPTAESSSPAKNAEPPITSDASATTVAVPVSARPSAVKTFPPETAGPATIADQVIATTGMGPAKIAAPAVGPEILAGAATGSATVAGKITALTGAGSAMGAGPRVSAAGKPEIAAASPAKHSEPSAETAPPRPAPVVRAPSFEDKVAAAMQRFLSRAPTGDEIEYLQEVVPDKDLLLECLDWMLPNPLELYGQFTLLASQISYYCYQTEGLSPSPFLDDRRRRKAARGSGRQQPYRGMYPGILPASA